MKLHWVLVILLVILQSSCKNQIELPTVDVYGHAGISLHRDRAIFPANSYEANQYAIDVLGADGVEMDIQMTKDSVLVLFHDPYLSQSSNIDGCISQYNYDQIKDLKLDFTKYKITKLKDVLRLTESRNVKVYIDIKAHSYCDGKFSLSAFQYALNNATNDLSDSHKAHVYLEMLDLEFLKNITYPTKCYESTNVKNGIQFAQENGFQAVLFKAEYIGQTESELLNNSGLYWGVFGIKDKWSIDNAISFSPKFVITDNIAYTNQITK